MHKLSLSIYSMNYSDAERCQQANSTLQPE